CAPSRPYLFAIAGPAPTVLYALSLHDALPIFALAAEGRHAVVRARDTVEVDALAERNDRHDDRGDRDDRQHQPAIGGDLTGGVALVRFLDQADHLRNHRVQKDDRGQDESEEVPERTN